MQVVMADRLEIPRLLERAKQGDRGAFDEVVTCSQGDLAAFIQRRIRPELRNQLDVQALTNDTLARAFESLERFTGHDVDCWFAWLAGIAKKVVLKEIERLNRSRVFELDRDIATTQPSPSRVLRREERFERLNMALEGLSEDHRDVIRLCRIEGRRIQDAAKLMSRSPGAVKMLLWRALKELKEKFGDTESLNLPHSPPGSEGGGDGQ